MGIYKTNTFSKAPYITSDYMLHILKVTKIEIKNVIPFIIFFITPWLIKSNNVKNSLGDLGHLLPLRTVKINLLNRLKLHCII